MLLLALFQEQLPFRLLKHSGTHHFSETHHLSETHHFSGAHHCRLGEGECCAVLCTWACSARAEERNSGVESEAVREKPPPELVRLNLSPEFARETLSP